MGQARDVDGLYSDGIWRRIHMRQFHKEDSYLSHEGSISTRSEDLRGTLPRHLAHVQWPHEPPPRHDEDNDALPSPSPSSRRADHQPVPMHKDPSFHALQEAIHACAARVMSVKHGVSAFSRQIIPT
jgi:hypothetical protein